MRSRIARPSLLLAALALASLSQVAAAQADFPSRPIRVMVGFAPGGSTDVLARALGQESRKSLGQELIIVNKPGATGVISANDVASASPDGYTIGVSPSTTFTLTHFVQDVRADLLESTSALVSIGRQRIGVLVKGDSPQRTLKEFIEHARRNPGRVAIGLPGAGTKVEMIMKAIGAQETLDMSFVPFQGDAPVSTAILGGHVTAGAFSAGAWGAHVRAGTMRLLASMEEERIDYAPEVPTLIELGYPYSGSTIVYAYGPKGVPAAVARRLIEAFAEASRSATYVEIVSKNGLDNRNQLAGEALERHLISDRANIGAMVDKLGLRKK